MQSSASRRLERLNAQLHGPCSSSRAALVGREPCRAEVQGPSKVVSVEEAVALIPDGAWVTVGAHARSLGGHPSALASQPCPGLR